MKLSRKMRATEPPAPGIAERSGKGLAGVGLLEAAEHFVALGVEASEGFGGSSRVGIASSRIPSSGVPELFFSM